MNTFDFFDYKFSILHVVRPFLFGVGGEGGVALSTHIRTSTMNLLVFRKNGIGPSFREVKPDPW